jgi:hypothetical protein
MAARRNALFAILQGALVVGILDITFAITFWWLKARLPPVRIFQSVAAGLLGRDAAANGGLPTAALGAFLHFFIAGSMVAAYYLVSGKVRALLRSPFVFGALYGLFLYFFMQLVVLPLSAAPHGKISWTSAWVLSSIAVHMFLVGVPCALFARRAHQGR